MTTVSTVMTLFVVPVFYHLLGRWTRSPDAIATELDVMRSEAVK